MRYKYVTNEICAFLIHDTSRLSIKFQKKESVLFIKLFTEGFRTDAVFLLEQSVEGSGAGQSTGFSYFCYRHFRMSAEKHYGMLKTHFVEIRIQVSSCKLFNYGGKAVFVYSHKLSIIIALVLVIEIESVVADLFVEFVKKIFVSRIRNYDFFVNINREVNLQRRLTSVRLCSGLRPAKPENCRKIAGFH